MEAQRTLGWYRDRLGFITGSKVGDILKSGRKKDEVFGETAKNYLYQLAAERSMNPLIVDDDVNFEDYVNATSFTTRAMQWGTEQEEYARDLFAKIYDKHIIEVGFCQHRKLPFFGSSPDGYCDDDKSRFCLEIKCPSQATYMRYVSEIHDAESLKRVEPNYFYQCMSHILCTKAQFVYFIAYCPFQKNPIHVVKIMPIKAEIDLMRERIELANQFIENIIYGK